MAENVLAQLEDGEQVILHLKGWVQINWWHVVLAVLAFASMSLVTAKGEFGSLWGKKLAIGCPLVAIGYAIYQFRRVLVITDRRILFRKWAEPGGFRKVKLAKVRSLGMPSLFVLPGLSLGLEFGDGVFVRQYRNLYRAYEALRNLLPHLRATEFNQRAFKLAHRIDGVAATTGCLSIFVAAPLVFSLMRSFGFNHEGSSSLPEFLAFALVLACAYAATELTRLFKYLHQVRKLAAPDRQDFQRLLMTDPLMRVIAQTALGQKLGL